MKEKSKKILKVLIIIVILFGGIVLGATNHEYGSNDPSIDITESTIKDNIVLDYIGQFIFAIGNIFQSLTSWVMGIFTGDSVFPWADKIVFNTIPLLDINFINPDESSLFGLTNEIGIGEIIRNVYFTGLSIAIGFLSILVAVMAIRLAITSIASEKAKYKEAITNFATTLVLLFAMHYFLAFMFYMNEQMVLVASKILSTTIEESGAKISEIINKDLEEKQKVQIENFINTAGGKLSQSDKNFLKNNYKTTLLLLNNSTFREAIDYLDGSDKTSIKDHLGKMGSKFLEGVSVGKYNSPEEQQLGFLVDCVTIVDNGLNSRAGVENFVENQMSKNEGKDLDELRRYTAVIYSFYEYEDAFDTWSSNLPEDAVTETGGMKTEAIVNFLKSQGGPDLTNYTEEQLQEVLRQQFTGKAQGIQNGGMIPVLNSEIEELQSQKSTYNDREKITANALLVALNYSLQAAKGELDLDSSSDNIISNLGEYFKQTAWMLDIDNGGWAPTKASIISAILYTIFVFQSISFFISYLKRIFMVVVLSVLAPFVIVYEYFKKTTIGSNGGIIGAWLKELATLIFVQTFQAFLLAIILSIIVSAIAGTYASTMDGGIEAVGLLAVFALLSLPKIELLVKNIFGLTSGVADTSLAAGQKSFGAGSMLALSAGRRLLDNPRKVVGGVKKMISSGARAIDDKKKSKDTKDKDTDNDENEDKDKDKSDSKENSNNKNNRLNSGGGAGRHALEGSGLTANRMDIDYAVERLSSALRTEKNNTPGDEFKEGLKDVASGLVETAGAAHGAIAGAVIGAGFNKDVLNSTVIGAGVGDKAGETALSAAYGALDTLDDGRKYLFAGLGAGAKGLGKGVGALKNLATNEKKSENTEKKESSKGKHAKEKNSKHETNVNSNVTITGASPKIDEEKIANSVANKVSEKVKSEITNNIDIEVKNLKENLNKNTVTKKDSTTKMVSKSQNSNTERLKKTKKKIDSIDDI